MQAIPSKILGHIFELSLSGCKTASFREIIFRLGEETPSVIPIQNQFHRSCVWSYLTFVKLHDEIKSSRKFFRLDHCCVCKICGQPLRFISAKKSKISLLNHFAKIDDFEHQQAYIAYKVEIGATFSDLENQMDTIGLSRRAMLPTILLQAARCDRADVAVNAVNSGCSKLITNYARNTYLHLAIIHKAGSIMNFALSLVIGRDLKIFLKLLTKENADGDSPLELACKLRDSRAVDSLLRHAIDGSSLIPHYTAVWGSLGRLDALAASHGAWSRTLLSRVRCAHVEPAMRSLVAHTDLLSLHSRPSPAPLAAIRAHVEAQPWWPGPGEAPACWDDEAERALHCAAQAAAEDADAARLAWLLDGWGAQLDPPPAAPLRKAEVGGVADFAACGAVLKRRGAHRLGPRDFEECGHRCAPRRASGLRRELQPWPRGLTGSKSPAAQPTPLAAHPPCRHLRVEPSLFPIPPLPLPSLPPHPTLPPTYESG
jgi:hypothetical protein